MIVVTGATGKLGQIVINNLLEKAPANQIIAAVRTPAKAKEFAVRGIQIREADYAKPETLVSAFAGAEKLLLISSNNVEQRIPQHKAAVDAARQAGVRLLAYTSILRADTSTLALASDHKLTEEYIRSSNLPFVFLRNGWYLENHTEALGPALQHGTILGAAKDGRFASASRTDYAAAAVAVLTGSGHEQKVYELAGDQSFSLSELAAEVARQSAKSVAYHNLPLPEYETALIGFGLPPALAKMLADADDGASRGELDSSSHDLSVLIGRPTMTMSAAVKTVLSV